MKAFVGWAGLAVGVLSLVLAAATRPVRGGESGHSGHQAMANEHTMPHMHAAVPAAYRGARPAASAWTDPATIERGRAIYESRCATCHGERGDGRGPAAQALPVKPPDLRDRHIVDEMTPDYWFWRVSEGGQVEPYRSMGSPMPAWKGELSPDDRWAVIAYQHTFSGHTGPHVASEHPALHGEHHGGHGHDADASPSASPAQHSHGRE